MRAARVGSFDTVSRLLKEGARVDYINDFGDTSLMEASSCGHTRIVRILEDAEKRERAAHERKKKAARRELELRILKDIILKDKEKEREKKKKNAMRKKEEKGTRRDDGRRKSEEKSSKKQIAVKRSKKQPACGKVKTKNGKKETAVKKTTKKTKKLNASAPRVAKAATEPLRRGKEVKEVKEVSKKGWVSVLRNGKVRLAA
jgi:hypothetical protein